MKWDDVIEHLSGAGSLETQEGAAIRLVAGLGNPGKSYDNTRHNIGFMVIDALAAAYGEKVNSRKFNALTEEIHAEGHKLLLVKPQQYMNRSGHVIATAAGFYKLAPENILIVTDDMALETGRLRMRAKGSAGGHNGLKDIIARLGTDRFPRLRVGIGDNGMIDAADYVLSGFKGDEKERVEQAVQTAVKAVLCWVRDGIDTAMTTYNAGPDKNAPDKV